jgi:lipoate-protein ligase A
VRVFIDPDKTAASQMARDHELFEAARCGESSARVYQWDKTWVTLGRFQKPSETLVDPDALNWTVRETGGAAVLHGHDLTLGIAVPVVGAAGVREVYRKLVMPIVLALQDLGLDAVLGEEAGFADRREGAYCFLGKSQNDVVSARTGQKLCGCALRVTREAALLQASIPIHEPSVRAELVIQDSGADLWTELDATQLARSLTVRLEELT